VRKEDGLSLASIDPGSRQRAIDRTCAVIDFAASFGAQVNIGTLRGHLGAQRGETQKLATDALARLLEYADGAGVILAIEPQSRFVIDWLNSSDETLRYIQGFAGPRPSLLFDVYHAMLEERSVAAAAIRARAAISYVQVSDSNRLAPGCGQFAVADALRVLRALDYNGYVSVECLQRPDSKTTATRAARFLTPLLDEEDCPVPPF
jgi:sugar phosphate isomerase/epimerase